MKTLLNNVKTALYDFNGTIFGKSFDQFFKALEQEVCVSCESLLDVGCGENSPVRYFSTSLSHTVGVDAFEPALSKSRSNGIHDEYYCLNVLNIKDKFHAQSFDCVVALDVIEHLKKEDGYCLLQSMERIANKKVIVFTPNGFLSQSAIGGNEFQRHLSGWEVEEMQDMGYQVLGMSGWKPLRGEEAHPRGGRISSFFTKRLSLLSEPFFVRRPTHAFQLLCVKDVT